MASSNSNWYAPAPTMLSRPPQQPSHYFNNNSNGATGILSTSFPKSYSSPKPSSMSIPMRPHAGRKRSRDESSGTHDDPSSSGSSLDRPPSPPKKPTIQPVYGPGMSLIYPGEPGFAVDASSQSGTWVEQREEAHQPGASLSAAVRPGLESRKSQRLAGDAPTMDDITLDVVGEAPRSTIEEPTIDEATRTLGIGWKVLSSDMEAARRGWARFVENHYPLQSVNIFWANNSLPAYLARAVCYGTPGYYLFDEDLDKCQMVAKSWEKALDNLRATPLVFEGEQVMTAHRSNGLAKNEALEVDLQGSGMDLD